LVFNDFDYLLCPGSTSETGVRRYDKKIEKKVEIEVDVEVEVDVEAVNGKL
jgi:hypothetical protein